MRKWMGWMVAAALLAAVGCTTCPMKCGKSSKAPVRYAWVTGLKPEMAAKYKDLHAHPWPKINKMIKDCHIQNYSIYVREIEGKLYLFSYLEYVGSDWAGDMAKMAADPETKRWWKETDPCQQPLPDAAAKGKIWSDTEEVYHLN